MDTTVATLLSYIESGAGGIAALSAGVAAVFHAVKWHRAWVLENTASKEDLVRIEAKLDALIELLQPPPVSRRTMRLAASGRESE